MLGFVQSWFAPGANPIGVDFGSDGLRLAQVEPLNAAGGNASAGAGSAGGTPVAGDFRLVAAARADVPSHLRHDLPARLAFFTESLRDLWASGNFRGRKAVLALPAASMTIQHLRMARMDDDAMKQALPWEARGKLPYDPTHAVLRHLVAGEIHQDGEQKNEVILMAAQREMVNAFLAAAVGAKFDVVGMNVEPRAVVDCFGHVYRRKTDGELTNLFVDVGCAGTRAFIARGGQILFARSIPVGGDHFTRAVASAMKISFEEAKVLRIKLCLAEPAAAAGATPPPALPTAASDAPSAPPSPPPNSGAGPAQGEQVAAACREPVAKMVDELALCRRYHEATFPALPIDRLVFIGGEARNRRLCQEVAQGMELAAQVGDPMSRMGRISDIGIESGIDRRLPQPDWAVAIGLSMGPASASSLTNAAASAPNAVLATAAAGKPAG